MMISLKPELEKFIAEKVTAGKYADASDIVNEALEALKEQDEFTPAHETYLRDEVRRGIEQLDSGKVSNLDARKIIAEERRSLADGRKRD